MKILQVIPYFHPAYAFGGPVKVAYQISRELAKKGHEIVIYTSDAKDLSSRLETNFEENIDGMKVYYFRNVSLILVKKLKLFITPQLALYADKEVEKFDIIHLHEYRTYQNLVVTYYAKKYGIPYILQAHGSVPRIASWRRLKWIYDALFGYKLLKNSSKVIALNRLEAEQYKIMGVPEEKIAIIPNGIDLSEYAGLPPKGVFKKKFNIPEDKKIILYLGRVHKVKGIDFLIKAYAYLVRKLNCKDVVLVIVGPDDGYLKEAQELTNRLGVSKHVLFTGSLYGRDKFEAYVDSEFCVLPSRYEIWGMTVLEAYACSKPVIASEIGGLKDLVVNGETGLLFESGNVKQLARCIFNLLNDGGLAKRMGLKARKFVEENFTIEKVVERLEKLYEEVIEG